MKCLRWLWVGMMTGVLLVAVSGVTWAEDTGEAVVSDVSEAVEVEEALLTEAVDEGGAPEVSGAHRVGGLLRRAFSALQENRLRDAELAFREAIRLDPHNKQAQFGLGTLYIKAGYLREAVDIMEPLVQENPNDYLIVNNLAWLYATAADLSVRNGRRAVELAQSALLLEPQDYHVWSTLSEAHFISGSYEKALRAAQEAERLCRELGNDEGLLQEYQQQVEKARRAAVAFSILE